MLCRAMPLHAACTILYIFSLFKSAAPATGHAQPKNNVGRMHWKYGVHYTASLSSEFFVTCQRVASSKATGPPKFSNTTVLPCSSACCYIMHALVTINQLAPIEGMIMRQAAIALCQVVSHRQVDVRWTVQRNAIV